MMRTYLGNTFFATGVCLYGVNQGVYYRQLLLSHQSPQLILKRKEYLSIGSEGLLKKVASRTHRDFVMRAWMTGLILAIFGLWLATI